MFGYRLALVSLAAVHLLGICDAFAIGPAAALLRPNALSAQSMPLRAPRVQGAGGRAAVCGALQMAAAKSFKNFDDMIENSEQPLILVDFYATWCGPCVLMSKELSKLSEKMGDEVGVFKVNTDKYPTISSRYEVYALPTCILFKAGKPVERFEGVKMADQVETLIRTHL